MSEPDNMQVVATFIVLGMPMAFAYFATQSIRWVVEMGTFTCAWWAAWKLMVYDND